jgi:SH3 domain protein
MKYLLYTSILFALLGSPVHGETMYITDNLQVTMRTGQGIDHKIISMLTSSQRVETRQSAGDWTLVRLPNGSEGWVLSRFLTTETPSRLALARVKKKAEKLSAKVAALLKENGKLKAENKSLGSELATNEQTVDTLSKSYSTLKTESAGYLELKSKYETTARQLTDITQQAQRLSEELKALKKDKVIQPILIGAGIVLVGFIFGYSARKHRRRSYL